MKALLFALVRAFEFELAVDPREITKKSGIVQRPVIHAGTRQERVELPLIFKAYRPI